MILAERYMIVYEHEGETFTVVYLELKQIENRVKLLISSGTKYKVFIKRPNKDWELYQI